MMSRFGTGALNVFHTELYEYFGIVHQIQYICRYKDKYAYKYFLFLHENIFYGYSLEATQRGFSDEHYNIYFYGEIKKYISA